MARDVLMDVAEAAAEAAVTHPVWGTAHKYDADEAIAALDLPSLVARHRAGVSGVAEARAAVMRAFARSDLTVTFTAALDALILAAQSTGGEASEERHYSETQVRAMLKEVYSVGANVGFDSTGWGRPLETVNRIISAAAPSAPPSSLHVETVRGMLEEAANAMADQPYRDQPLTAQEIASRILARKP